jgi:ABC-2 type transport system permease protein
MTLPLVRKLLRDARVPLAVVALLLGAFQVLWARVVARISGQLAPLFTDLAAGAGMTHRDLQDKVFSGPGKIVRTIIGGESIDMDRAMDLLSVGYVHPLMVTIFCIWGVGRAAGAIAGEIDRGTMELLLSQPLARARLILAHLCVDFVTIPVLCLSLWAGNYVGAWVISPIKVESATIKLPVKTSDYLVELGPFRVRVAPPESLPAGGGEAPRRKLSAEERLRVSPADFGPALWSVGGLIFAVTGMTMWLSSAGRFRWRVLGVAVLVVLLQFLVNVIGQMYEPLGFLRPLTIFYYYQPQQVVLGGGAVVTFHEWDANGSPLAAVPALPVLYGVGLAGYALALVTFTRRDLPAPL